jgi:hypothetical protein
MASVAFVVLVLAVGCRRHAPQPPALPSCEERSRDVRRGLDQLAGTDQRRVRDAIARAHAWLDGVAIDPFELARRGLFGKRKLSELLSGYYELWKVAEGEQREAIVRRVSQIAQPVRQPKFHDMHAVDGELFNQESTSYLWIAYMLEHMGQDVSDYRARITGLQARLDARLQEGGPQVRQILKWQYAHFGLAWPGAITDPRRDFILSSRPDFRGLDKDGIYRLTHEVFALYEYGDAAGADPIGIDELRYLRVALYWLTRNQIRAANPDLTAELATCLRLVRAVDLPVLTEALAYLLDVQNPSGAWGRFEEVRIKHGEDMERLYQLHTTVVALQAVLLSFHPHWNRDTSARCPPDVRQH